jgi:hypothetical protein
MVIKIKKLRIAVLLSACVTDRNEDSTFSTLTITDLNKFNINRWIRPENEM